MRTLTKWAVVACDSSPPSRVLAGGGDCGDAPSTLRLILPGKLNDGCGHLIADINGAMNRYLAEGVFQTLPGSLFYIEHAVDGKVRHGLIGMVDLDQYDFTPAPAPDPGHGGRCSPASTRVRVRQDAPVELPHVMLLIDDPDHGY
ncbi:MAG: DUF1015 family protein [Dysosmobacter welbionis]